MKITSKQKKILIGTGIAGAIGVTGLIIYKAKKGFGDQPPPAGMQEDYDEIKRMMKRFFWVKTFHGYFEGIKWHKTDAIEEKQMEQELMAKAPEFEQKYGIAWGKAKDVYDLK